MKNNFRFVRSGLVMAAAVLLSVPAFAQEEALKVQQAFNAVAEAARPAVVSVRVLREEVGVIVEPEFFFGQTLPVQKYYRYDTGGIGSGVIVDPAGSVLTNEHVVSGAERIQVLLQDKNGRQKTYMASVAASDKRLDLAVLKMKAADKFPFLRFAAEPAKVGDWAIAVGYPFGFKQTMTSGIVSAVDLSMRIEGRRYAELVQTDAAINQGNSGGPLLNLKGEIIGINSAIYSPSGAFAGMGFAIPAQEVKRAYEDFLGLKPARRGWLGAALVGVDEATASRLGLPPGAMISRLVPNSPAATAGLQRGDIVVSFNGDEVGDDTDLLALIYARKPGDKVELGYFRDGSVKKTTALLGEQHGSGAGDFDY